MSSDVRVMTPISTIFVLAISLAVVDAVINGRRAVPGEFPYQVLLTTILADQMGLCGGAIIDEKHILTAWHCVEDVRASDISVIVGAIAFENDPNAKKYRVSNIALHEKRACRRPGQLRCYDIALLRTTQPMEMNDFISEIPLPDHDIIINDECVLSGWGSERHSDRKLRSTYGFILPTELYGPVHDYELVFGTPRRSRAIVSTGDSGSPLVCDGFPTGIIIRGSDDRFEPVVAINVFRVRDFINRRIDEVACRCCIQ